MEEIFTIAREITVTALLIIGILALIRGDVVTRFQYDEMVRMFEDRIRRLKNGNADH